MRSGRQRPLLYSKQLGEIGIKTEAGAYLLRSVFDDCEHARVGRSVTIGLRWVRVCRLLA